MICRFGDFTASLTAALSLAMSGAGASGIGDVDNDLGKSPWSFL
jgi:hypothetical protein